MDIQIKKDKLFWYTVIFVFFVTIALRFVWLGNFPSGMNHDDTELMLSAKTYFIYHTDSSGAYLPLSIVKNGLESQSTGVPSILLAPFLGLLPTNLSSVHLAYGIVNILTAFGILLLIKRLTKKNKFAALSSLTFLLMPWSFAYSRYTLATPIVVLLLVYGLYFLFSKNKKQIYTSSLFFILASYSYFGSLPVILAITFFSSLLAYKKTKLLKPILMSFLVLLIAVFGYMLIAKHTPNSLINQRSWEFAFQDLDRFSVQVNDDRRTSIDFPLNNIFINKYTAIFDETLRKYVKAFGTDNLFYYGDPRAAYNFGNQGFLLPLDLLLIPVGIVGLYVVSPILLGLVATLTVFGPSASVLNVFGEFYIFRSYPLTLAFPIISAAGLYFISQKSENLKLGKFILPGLLIIYLGFFLRFTHFFLLSFPVQEEDNFATQERVVSNYLLRTKQPTYLVVLDPHPHFKSYVFFSGELNLLKENDYTSQEYKFNNIIISSECPKTFNGTVIIDTRVDCKYQNGERKVIQWQRDSGSQYDIYNDQVCNSVDLTSYRRIHKVSDYDIERLSTEEFCNRWIFRY